MAMTELERKLLGEVQDMRHEHERQQKLLCKLLQKQTEQWNSELNGLSNSLEALKTQLNEYERRLNKLSP